MKKYFLSSMAGDRTIGGSLFKERSKYKPKVINFLKSNIANKRVVVKSSIFKREKIWFYLNPV